MRAQARRRHLLRNVTLRDTDAQCDANRAMARYAAGDSSAFAALYPYLQPRLYGYFFRRTREMHAAEDLVQHTLLHIHRWRARFVRGADLMPWALAIARHLLLDRARRVRRADDARDADQLPVPSPVASPDEALLANDLMARLGRAVAVLPEPLRLAFELTRQRGLPPDEAAATLGITVGALRVRLHRAQQSLAATLRSRDG